MWKPVARESKHLESSVPEGALYVRRDITFVLVKVCEHKWRENVGIIRDRLYSTGTVARQSTPLVIDLL